MPIKNTKHFFLILSSTILALLLAEFVLSILDNEAIFPSFFSKIRTSSPPWHTKSGTGLYYAHPYTGYAIKPGYKSAASDVRINSLGFRGVETTREKTKDTFRVVALGGSTTYGILLPDNSTYPYLLQGMLRDRLHTDRIEVINAGLVSATSAESLHRMFTDILPLNPDMIVIYHAYNDLVPRMFNNFSEDYYHFRKIPTDRGNFMDRSYLYRIVLRALNPVLFYENANLTTHTWKLENLPDIDARKIANFRNTSSEIFAQNIQHIVDIAHSKGVQIILSTFAIDNNTTHWNDSMPSELWEEGILENNREIRNIAETNQLPLIEFYSYALQDKTMFRDSIHMNAHGSAKKASFFADTISPAIQAFIDIK